jgi:hypothetical protein
MKAACLLVIAACATPRIATPRFHNAPPVTVVNDRLDVPVQPKAHESLLGLYFFDGVFGRQVTRALELPRARRALGVNSLDEVPDSTWFTNRIGVRELSLDELRRGPLVAGSPEPHKPWTILSGKRGGVSVGFVIRDARGEKYLLKFDPRGQPEAETAADVITNRLLWAFGYNVPEDYIVHLRRDELVLSPKATTKDALGRKIPLDQAEVDRSLELVEIGRDGAIRGMVSRILDGAWLGGHPGEGVRSDDPNDRIPHELRRDLRGQFAPFAWLDHLDIKEHNTLDMWVADRENPKHHYVKHYLIDFGKSLGFMATDAHNLRRGYAFEVDYGDILASLVSMGLWTRPWEDRTQPALRGVGAFGADTFDPAGWKPHSQAYLPIQVADRFDKFWGAKILMRFTRAQLRAVVELGQLSDPRATDYLVDTLVARQRLTGQHWFRQVNPLDGFAIERVTGGHALCFDDLALRYQLASMVATRYRLRRYDREGRLLAEHAIVAATARTCPPAILSEAGDGYTIVELTTTRPGFSGSTLVHLARDPVSREPRVIGVWRP